MNDALAWVKVAESADGMALKAVSAISEYNIGGSAKDEAVSALMIANLAWKRAFLASRRENKAPDATTPGADDDRG